MQLVELTTKHRTASNTSLAEPGSKHRTMLHSLLALHPSMQQHLSTPQPPRLLCSKLDCLPSAQAEPTSSKAAHPALDLKWPSSRNTHWRPHRETLEGAGIADPPLGRRCNARPDNTLHAPIACACQQLGCSCLHQRLHTQHTQGSSSAGRNSPHMSANMPSNHTLLLILLLPLLLPKAAAPTSTPAAQAAGHERRAHARARTSCHGVQTDLGQAGKSIKSKHANHTEPVRSLKCRLQHQTTNNLPRQHDS